MRKLIPIILAVFGLCVGLTMGFFLRPQSHEAVVAADACTTPSPETGASAEEPETAVATTEFVKLNNQFIVPVVTDGVVEALVILSLSLEVKTGSNDKVYAVEPKLRDSFLQTLFDHANAGGFAGSYTNSNNLDVLRAALLEVAKKTLGDTVTAVLIVDIVRQDA